MFKVATASFNQSFRVCGVSWMNLRPRPSRCVDMSSRHFIMAVRSLQGAQEILWTGKGTVNNDKSNQDLELLSAGHYASPKFDAGANWSPAAYG